MKKLIKLLIKRIKKDVNNNKGMSLIEIMIVIAIIGIVIGAIVGPQVFNAFKKAKYQTAGLDMQNIKTALFKYQMDNNNYPTTEQGLQALVKEPDSEPAATNYNPGGYLSEKKLKDQWGSDYLYFSPGDNGEGFILISLASDKKEGGTGFDKDIRIDDK